MNKYLFYEYPLQVSPSLCEVIGVNEAIFIQQLHYRLLSDNKEINGMKWICITYGELQEDLRFFFVKYNQTNSKKPSKQKNHIS